MIVRVAAADISDTTLPKDISETSHSRNLVKR